MWWSYCTVPIDIYWRSRTSYTTPCNGIVNHGAQIGDLRVFADHTRKTNAPTIFARRAVFYVCLSSRSDCSRCRWQSIHTWRTTVILITGKTWRPPIWAPCWNKYGAASGISGVTMTVPVPAVMPPDLFFFILGQLRAPRPLHVKYNKTRGLFLLKLPRPLVGSVSSVTVRSDVTVKMAGTFIAFYAGQRDLIPL